MERGRTETQSAYLPPNFSAACPLFFIFSVAFFPLSGPCLNICAGFAGSLNLQNLKSPNSFKKSGQRLVERGQGGKESREGGGVVGGQ